MDKLLPGYAAGTLAEADNRRVRAHLVDCARCRADLASWRAVAAAVTPDDQEAPEPARMVRAVLTRSALAGADRPDAHAWGRLRGLGALVLAEARLIRLAVPVASALVMALGVAVVMVYAARGVVAPGGGSAAGDLLALIAPIVAAVGVAGTCRSRHDPAAELVAATPMSGRLLVLVRLTLVLGYDLALALAASAVLAVTDTVTPTAAGLNALIGAWLGPMALLSALSLLLAVWFGPDVALGTAVGLWTLRMLAGGLFADDSWATRVIMAAWSTNAVVLAASVALGVAGVVAAGRLAGEPNSRWRATHPM